MYLCIGKWIKRLRDKKLTMMFIIGIHPNMEKQLCIMNLFIIEFLRVLLPIYHSRVICDSLGNITQDYQILTQNSPERCSRKSMFAKFRKKVRKTSPWQKSLLINPSRLFSKLLFKLSEHFSFRWMTIYCILS